MTHPKSKRKARPQKPTLKERVKELEDRLDRLSNEVSNIFYDLRSTNLVSDSME